jgi:CHAT domain-containing protein
LRDDGKLESQLRLDDVLRWRTNISLVVLSGCETAAGRSFEGDGVLSLAAAFTAGGARSVLASAWRVPDESTSEWMAAFYEALIKDSLPAAEATLKAQDAVRSNPKWQHPFYWGAFSLTSLE